MNIYRRQAASRNKGAAGAAKGRLSKILGVKPSKGFNTSPIPVTLALGTLVGLRSHPQRPHPLARATLMACIIRRFRRLSFFDRKAAI